MSVTHMNPSWTRIHVHIKFYRVYTENTCKAYRNPSCSRISIGTRSLTWTRIAPRRDINFFGHSRDPTSCRSVSRGRNPSWSRSP